LTNLMINKLFAGQRVQPNIAKISFPTK